MLLLQANTTDQVVQGSSGGKVRNWIVYAVVIIGYGEVCYWAGYYMGGH